MSANRSRFQIALAALLLLLGQAAWGDDVSIQKLLEQYQDRQGSGEPPRQMPEAERSPESVKYAYLCHDGTFDLLDGRFYLIFHDTPRVVLIKFSAQYISQNDQFYFFYEPRMQIHWAFAKHEGAGGGFAVWQHLKTANKWELFCCHARQTDRVEEQEEQPR